MDQMRERFLNVSLEMLPCRHYNQKRKKLRRPKKAPQMKPRTCSDEQLTAQTWFERGYVFQGDKNFEEAFRCYSEAVRLEPNLDAAHNNIGALLKELKRYEEAEAAYRKAIELNPSYATAYSNLGILLNDLKRYDEAEAAYRKAIELNEASPSGTIRRTPPPTTTWALLLRDLKRYEEAEAAYRKAIELNPSYATAYSNLGILCRQPETLRRSRSRLSQSHRTQSVRTPTPTPTWASYCMT